jgi:hypothetical protein
MAHPIRPSSGPSVMATQEAVGIKGRPVMNRAAGFSSATAAAFNPPRLGQNCSLLTVPANAPTTSVGHSHSRTQRECRRIGGTCSSVVTPIWRDQSVSVAVPWRYVGAWPVSVAVPWLNVHVWSISVAVTRLDIRGCCVSIVVVGVDVRRCSSICGAGRYVGGRSINRAWRRHVDRTSARSNVHTAGRDIN